VSTGEGDVETDGVGDTEAGGVVLGEAEAEGVYP